MAGIIAIDFMTAMFERKINPNFRLGYSRSEVKVTGDSTLQNNANSSSDILIKPIWYIALVESQLPLDGGGSMVEVQVTRAIFSN